MKRSLLAAILVAGFLPTMSSAVELKNIHVRYGPMGAPRVGKEILPGDIIFMTYDIENLVIDAKTGKASYVAILELLDSQNKPLYDSKNPMEVMPQLGGTRMPGDLHLILGPKLPAGRYAIKLTVHDKLGKDAKAFEYKFELAPRSFGIVGVLAPAFGFPGQMYKTELNFVNMALDTKAKTCDVDVDVRILDDAGKAVVPTVKIQYPRDLPPDVDLMKENIIPLVYPIYLNRAGRFTMEFTATDKIAKKSSKLSYSFSVIDINNLSK